MGGKLMNKKRIGIKIKQIRQRKGLTQEEFGQLIDGANKGVVSKWERGVSLPNNSRLAKIAEYANTDIDYLLYDRPKISSNKKQEDIKHIEEILSKVFNKYKQALSYIHGKQVSSTFELIQIDQLKPIFIDQFLLNDYNINHHTESEIEERAKDILKLSIEIYFQSLPNTDEEMIEYIKEKISLLILLPTLLFNIKSEITDLQSDVTEKTTKELISILKNTHFEILKLQELN